MNCAYKEELPQTRKHKQCGKEQNCKENERSETEQDAKLQKTFQQHLIKTVRICNRQKVKTFTRKQKKGGKEKKNIRSYLVNHRRFCKNNKLEERPAAEQEMHREFGGYFYLSYSRAERLQLVVMKKIRSHSNQPGTGKSTQFSQVPLHCLNHEIICQLLLLIDES